MKADAEWEPSWRTRYLVLTWGDDYFAGMPLPYMPPRWFQALMWSLPFVGCLAVILLLVAFGVACVKLFG